MSFVSFFVLSLLSFLRNVDYLFYGVDGRYEVSLIALGSLFVPPWPGFTNDFVHGLGNIWFSVNPWFIPGYLLSLSRYGDFDDFPLAYAICAGGLFLAIFISARLIGAPRWSSLAAAWLVPLLTYQYAGWSLIPSTFRAFPHYGTIAGVTALVAVMLMLISELPLLSAALAAAFAFLGISYIVIVSPTLLILGAPLFAISGLVSLIACSLSPRFATRIAIMAAVPSLCLAFGFASFLIGLTANTAASFFETLSVRPSDIREVSLLFWNPLHPALFWNPFHPISFLVDLFTIERGFIILGLLGGVWTAFRAQGVLRLAAIAFLASALLYLAIGIVHTYHPFWFGPAPWYFEGFLFPFHGIFTAILLSELARVTIQLVSPARYFRRYASSLAAAVMLSLTIAAVPWFHVSERQKHVPPSPPLGYEAYPQPETAITRILKDEIALSPGASFRGREATLVGRIFPLSTSVSTLSGILDLLALHATGNYHDYAGLWQDAIPTLLEYNPLMTPAYFAFGRTFFTEPADVQIRNLLIMRRIDPRMLAAVGVRFVVTDAPFDGKVRLRQTLPIPVDPTLLPRYGVHESISSFALYLYELEQVNLGQYSPTEIRHVETASEILDVLADPSVDLARTAITREDVPSGLMSATLTDFTVEKGFFRLKAGSDGWSLLILPMEYSSCLRLEPKAYAAGARLFRVDLLMTGVLFNKQLDARLTYRTGPLVGSRCRSADAKEMEAIKIRDAFAHRPELAPVAITSY